MNRNRAFGIVALLFCLTIVSWAIAPIGRCCVLSFWGQLGESHVDRIGNALRTDESSMVRRYAASLLAELGRPKSRLSQQRLGVSTQIAVDALLYALTDEDLSVRIEAAKAVAVIAHYNQLDEIPLDSLIDVINTETNDDARTNIVRAVGSIGRDADLLVPSLVAALAHASPSLRLEVIRTLRVLRSDRRKAVPFLIDAAQGSDFDTSLQAIMTLHSIGPDAKEAIPALNELSRHSNEQTRTLAIFALRQIHQMPQ